MFKPPPGWPQISSAIFYEDPAAAIDWLEKAFGFVVRVKVETPDGLIAHSELEFGDGVVMVGTAGGMRGSASPRKTGGLFTQSLYVFVEDVDAHFERACAAGATVVSKPATQDYGDRHCTVADPEGHNWTFGQRVDQAAWDRSTAEGASA